MRIDHSSTASERAAALNEAARKYLAWPGDTAERPCPGCAAICPSCGSGRCVCGCGPACAEAPRALSSAPDAFPIEPGILPLVYALRNLRLGETCWSCEGHEARPGLAARPPRVWFYATDPPLLGLLARLLDDMADAHVLGAPWRLGLIATDNDIDLTFALEPAPRPSFDLGALRRDVRVLAAQLRPGLDGLARRLLGS